MTEPGVHNVDGRRQTTLEQIAATLEELTALWPRMEQALLPGTRRRWAEREQEVDDKGRPIPEPAETRCPDCGSVRLRLPDWKSSPDADETLHGKPYCPLGCDNAAGAPGYSRSPASDDALSVLVSVGTDLAWLEDSIRTTLGFTALDEQDELHEAHRHRNSMSRLSGRDPMQAAAWLRDALPALVEHAEMARHVDRELTRMTRTVRRSLGDIEPVHLIKAPCPICDCLSLRAFPERELIVCIHENCQCSDPDCGCTNSTRRFRHRWRRDQWSWLAQVLGVDLEETQAG
jgi:hypothetical protein